MKPLLQLFPGKQQWAKWSLPSKLTAIGTLVGIISLSFALIAYLFPINNIDSRGLIFDEEIYDGFEADYLHTQLDDLTNKSNCAKPNDCKNTLTNKFYEYAKSKYYEQKINLGDAISLAAINNKPFYLKIFFASSDMDEIKKIDDEQKTIYSFNLANNNVLSGGVNERIALIESGTPIYLIEDMLIVLENPENLKNGFNVLETCRGLHINKLTGFYLFSYHGSYQGVQVYYGYLAQVDPDKALRTINHYNSLNCLDY